MSVPARFAPDSDWCHHCLPLDSLYLGLGSSFTRRSVSSPLLHVIEVMGCSLLWLHICFSYLLLHGRFFQTQRWATSPAETAPGQRGCRESYLLWPEQKLCMYRPMQNSSQPQNDGHSDGFETADFLSNVFPCMSRVCGEQNGRGLQQGGSCVTLVFSRWGAGMCYRVPTEVTGQWGLSPSCFYMCSRN